MGSQRVGHNLVTKWPSLIAQLVKNLPAVWETWVLSLGWEDPLDKEKAPSPVSWPGEFLGVAQSRTQLSDFHFQTELNAHFLMQL